MLHRIRPEFLAEQSALEAMIRAAFRGVTRDGGISWSEAHWHDFPEDFLSREHARANDTEPSWEALVDSTTWKYDESIGGFSFLDPIGFRYYVAPAMLRCMRDRGGGFFRYSLEIDTTHRHELIALINRYQAQAIARFLRFMIAIDDDESWSRAYRKFWIRVDVGSPL